MLRLQSDLLPALIAARDGVLKDVDLRWRDETALCVVMAAKGYPDDPQRGSEIRGLAAARGDPDVKIFHAGTRGATAGPPIADGGRVLGVTALGSDIAAAATAPMPRSTGSIGRKAFAAAISARDNSPAVRRSAGP